MAHDLKQHLPVEMASKLAGYTWKAVNVGRSSAEVFRLDEPSKPSLYLKANFDRTEKLLQAEAVRREWLDDKLVVPHVCFFLEDDAGEFLLTSEVAGVDASLWCHQLDPSRLVAVLA